MLVFIRCLFSNFAKCFSRNILFKKSTVRGSEPVIQLWWNSIQAHHVYSTLKRLWNRRGLFEDLLQKVAIEMFNRLQAHMQSSGWYSVEKVFLKSLQNSQENTSTRVTFLIKLQALSPRHRCFSCEYREILKITFFHRTPPVAASANYASV